MLLYPAAETDYAAIAELANLAYRGTGPGAIWNVEAGVIGGERLSESLLREDLAAKPNANLLTYRDDPEGPLLGTVWLEPRETDIWYLGLLTVHPDLQKRQLGRDLLAAAEDFARERGSRKIHSISENALIAWYQRRGYTLTGETEPFRYHDERFGRPLRSDLHFVVLEKEL